MASQNSNSLSLRAQERENALGDKEKMILHLRSENRTLDNFRYVLDHRLQQLMKERGPIAKHIEDQRLLHSGASVITHRVSSAHNHKLL